jgi:hypothetical protein
MGDVVMKTSSCGDSGNGRTWGAYFISVKFADYLVAAVFAAASTAVFAAILDASWSDIWEVPRKPLQMKLEPLL